MSTVKELRQELETANKELARLKAIERRVLVKWLDTDVALDKENAIVAYWRKLRTIKDLCTELLGYEPRRGA